MNETEDKEVRRWEGGVLNLREYSDIFRLSE